MRSAASFHVFAKWKNATEYAFGSRNKPSIVPPEDKDDYAAVYDELMGAAQRAHDATPGAERTRLRPMNFSPRYGSRGHRPVDLWVSLCGEGSEAFGQMPQVYAIASERGLEVGFAATIDEADYHDPEVKARNRTFVPLLNAKLPHPNSELTTRLDDVLRQQGGWHFNTKTRLVAGNAGFDDYDSAADLLTVLKGSMDASGGGTICRVFPIDQLATLDLAAEFSLALGNFMPLIAACAPEPWDIEILASQDIVSKLVPMDVFDPSDIEDARRKVLAAVARRQGQRAFRDALMKAYDGRCAISGTAVPSVLQAAHITPYLGEKTNHVTNGLLLRADLHTLFDLRFIRIDPDTLMVSVSESLKGSLYEEFDGRSLRVTARPAWRPSTLALRQQYELPAPGFAANPEGSVAVA